MSAVQYQRAWAATLVRAAQLRTQSSVLVVGAEVLARTVSQQLADVAATHGVRALDANQAQVLRLIAAHGAAHGLTIAGVVSGESLTARRVRQDVARAASQRGMADAVVADVFGVERRAVLHWQAAARRRVSTAGVV